MIQQQKPNFFIIGMPRSGTTSMYTYLKQHPDVYLSIYKEPHFFGTDLTTTVYTIRDPGLYLSLFARAGDSKRIGEASVWYLTSMTAAAEIKAFNPAARIIIMLRNPLDMIYSLHSLYLRTGNEDIPDFQQALEIQPQRRQGLSLPKNCYFPEGLQYTAVAKYHEKIERFIRHFGRENLQVVIFEEFVRSTPGVYRETLEFLNLETGFPVEFDPDKAAKAIQSQVLRQIRHCPAAIKEKLSLKLGLDAHQGPPRQPLPAALKQHLSPRFREDLEKTSQLLGRDLTHWANQ